MINSGFMEIIIRGTTWSVIRRCSRVCAGWIGVFRIGAPICVDRNTCREYDAVISINSPNKMMIVGHQLKREAAIRSSPVKFMLGGVAIFMRLVRSHQVVVIGIILWNPRVRIRIRVWVRS